MLYPAYLCIGQHWKIYGKVVELLDWKLFIAQPKMNVSLGILTRQRDNEISRTYHSSEWSALIGCSEVAMTK